MRQAVSCAIAVASYGGAWYAGFFLLRPEEASADGKPGGLRPTGHSGLHAAMRIGTIDTMDNTTDTQQQAGAPSCRRNLVQVR